MKPEDWYVLWGAQQQVERGDNRDEKPMWAARRRPTAAAMRWEKWERYKGILTRTPRVSEFVKAYGKAQMRHAPSSTRRTDTTSTATEATKHDSRRVKDARRSPERGEDEVRERR